MKTDERQAALAGAQAGDLEALGGLLDSYRPYTHAICRGFWQDQHQGKFDESDLIQDALLEAHRCFGSFRGSHIEEFVGWLRQITVRSAYKTICRELAAAKRDSGQQQPLNRLVGVLAGSATSPSSVASRHERGSIRTIARRSMGTVLSVVGDFHIFGYTCAVV